VPDYFVEITPIWRFWFVRKANPGGVWAHRGFLDLIVVSYKCKVEMLRLLVIGSLTFVPFKNVGLTAGTAPECEGWRNSHDFSML
jgi:hypothetical protein